MVIIPGLQQVDLGAQLGFCLGSRSGAASEGADLARGAELRGRAFRPKHLGIWRGLGGVGLGMKTWKTYGIFMGFYGIFMGFLWDFYGILWDFYGILWDFMGFLWDFYGISRF